MSICFLLADESKSCKFLPAVSDADPCNPGSIRLFPDRGTGGIGGRDAERA